MYGPVIYRYDNAGIIRYERNHFKEWVCEWTYDDGRDAEHIGNIGTCGIFERLIEASDRAWLEAYLPRLDSTCTNSIATFSYAVRPNTYTYHLKAVLCNCEFQTYYTPLPPRYTPSPEIAPPANTKLRKLIRS